MARVPRQAHRRLKVFVFLTAVSAIVIIGVLMFASYTDELSKNRNYLTLGFNHIFVLSKRGNEQRRRVMAKQLQFQGIPFGFFPALTEYDIEHLEDYVPWIGEEHWAKVPHNHTQSTELLADFRTHMNVINDIVRLEFGSALVLSDRIDMEVILSSICGNCGRTAVSWEILYLGHCSEPKTHRPTLLHEKLFVAYQPQCAFAYAVSRQGAIRLKRILDNMWPYPQFAFDQQLAELVRPLYLEAYVIEPPLITESGSAAEAHTPGAQIRPLGRSTLGKMGISGVNTK
ncbi:hypothetical protein BX661DRAFT_198360 [Kickxella alabastrina]|uniref:uncharacterized protein n=1 Tax=Kickxella alabastrina TaxID=61397 RepID=UPI00221EDF19|nr:uncharacterized protein BX661DRAFT_198360 [Kickxella alabastrina]KAI7827768.1 hypothetical protein BX661DRAFT_198360 [Kickxella alabastrina]